MGKDAENGGSDEVRGDNRLSSIGDTLASREREACELSNGKHIVPEHRSKRQAIVVATVEEIGCVRGCEGRTTEDRTPIPSTRSSSGDVHSCGFFHKQIAVQGS